MFLCMRRDLGVIFNLVSPFSQKNKTYKMILRVCVCVCVCVCACLPVWLSVCIKLLIYNSFHTVNQLVVARDLGACPTPFQIFIEGKIFCLAFCDLHYISGEFYGMYRESCSYCCFENRCSGGDFYRWGDCTSPLDQ